MGSGIGQSIVDALRLCGNSYRIIGFDANLLAYGGFFCDVFYKTMPNQKAGYIESLIDICKREGIKIIIPGLDDELILLSRAKKQFEDNNIWVLVSPESLIEICLNKKRLSQKLNPLFPEIVASFFPEEAKIEIEKGRIHFPLIAKPLRGAGSKGISLIQNLLELGKISKDFIIQPFVFADENDSDSFFLLEGIEKREIFQVAEISVQYLISKRGKILGRMATRHKLKNGVPIEIIPIDNPFVWKSTHKIVEYLISLGAYGPINLQGRHHSNQFYIFKINPRFTGITGLRAKMGFNEVEASIIDYLGTNQSHIKRVLDYNTNHFGVRQVNDVKFSTCIKSFATEYIKNKKINYSKHQKKVFLLTGATGYVGQNLLRKLIKSLEIKQIITVVRDKGKVESVFGSIENSKIKYSFYNKIPVQNWNLG